MCGVAGTINWGDEEVLQRMISMQAHRGPDDQGTWQTAMPDGTRVGLGSRRLSILDLSPAGHMPMTTADGRFTIAYNGEIYNYPELRSRLEARGCQFRSHSDTEAVLYMYQEFGPESVRDLNGMFAIAIWDNQRQHLFLARDHFGIKPLYYTQNGERFGFASELKALLLLPGLQRSINYPALGQYLSMLWVPDPLTVLEGIFKLPAGHYAIFKHGKLEITQFWDLNLPGEDHVFPQDEHALAEELRSRFFATVKSQMRSDVPVGAFLSAGIDSSCIVAGMARATDKPVRTFTIAPSTKYQKGSGYLMDDTQVAQRTAAHFGCDHTEIVCEPDVASLLPKLLWHMDEPTADPAILSCYLVCQEARKSVTVVLAGNGGDELFGGYRKYLAHFLAKRYQMLPGLLRRGMLEPAALAMPSLRGTRLARYVHLAKKMARSGSLAPRERFIRDSQYLSEAAKRELCTDATWTAFGGMDPRVRHFEHFRGVGHADFLNQMLYVDSKLFLVSLNLTYNDKMSMANSLESRVPYLDWQFAQWAMSNIPPSLKLHGRTTKYILRKAMAGIVPDEVFQQSKAGFGVPLDYWLANDLREMVDDLLGAENVRKRGLFNYAVIERMIAEHRQGVADWSMQLWQFLTLELWMREFLDASSPRMSAEWNAPATPALAV